MELVELFRLRRSLRWYLALLGLAWVATVLLGHVATVQLDGTSKLNAGAVDLTGLVPISMLAASIFATWSGLTLARENATLEIAWTKPIPRSVLAWRYGLIGGAGVVLAFVVAELALVLALEALGARPIATSTLPSALALSAGVALMWYGLTLLLTARLPAARGGWVAGLMWPVAQFLAAATSFPGPLAPLVRLVDVVNPFAYLNGATIHDDGGVTLLAANQLPTDLRAMIVWALAIAFVAAAALVWPRHEA